ncbi:hypothetical protein [Enterocloster clostridioformis]|uniref:Uncharacterized protein n=1 Tax=Enterocloster clostridioformis TaxID=1531 RepID=A0A174SUA5_9FIRM|nr:hypothetical protein [Enterocloster clostridioformis]CUQ01313.1 Uncharacterised protein [Enterocloster clostridioformis]
MATVDEILARQAYADGDETWTKDNNYPSYTLYVEPEYVPVTNKRIADFNDQISVRGEQNAQFVGFQLPRYDDGLDLTAQHLYIHYQTVYGGGDGVPCNVSKSDNYVRMCWKIPAQATQEPGTIQMMIYATGANSAGERVTWKTLPASYTIHDGLDIGGGIPEPDQSWYEQFVAQMEGRVSTAQGYANDAQASKTAAAGSATASAESAAASAQALADNKAYVESQKETFVGYNKRETDLKYANALIGSAADTMHVTVDDAWEAPIPGLEIAGKSEQVVTTGAQLLDLSAVSKSAGGAVINTADGGYQISGTGALTEAFSASYQLDYLKNHLKPGNLILKSELTMPKLYVRIWDGSTVLAEMQGNSTKQITQEMINNENMRVECFLYGSAGSTITPGTYHPMLYQDGDGTWEPYTGGRPSPSPEYPQEIVSTDVTAVTVTGANLLIPQISNNGTGCKASLTEDGMVLIKGISKDSEYNDLYLYGKWGNSEDYGLRGTYTISCTHNGLLKLISITNHRSTIASTSENELTFTVTDENPINGIFIRLYPNTTYDCTLKIMLNIGDTALPWEPYQSKTAAITLTEPLRGIGDVRDRIMCRNGVWGIERKIVPLILNGSETWNQFNTSGSKSFGTADFDSLIKIGSALLCDRLSEDVADNVWNARRDNTIANSYNTTKNLRIFLNSTATLDTLKALLSEDPMHVIAERKSPTWEPLPADTQSALNAITTYKGRTTITVTAEGPEPDVAVEYVQDTRMVIADLQAQINEIRNGGTT